MSGIRPPQVRVPTAQTLKRYGLTSEEWLSILESQGWVCPICEQVPKTGRFVTDHEHVKSYRDLPPEKKRLFVRGILCWFCNHAYLGRGITIQKSRNATAYLQAYESRRPSRE